MKPGFLTSEFWLSVAALAVGFVHKKIGLDLDPMSLLTLFGSVATYVFSRGWAKAKAATGLVGQAPTLPPL